MTLTNCYVTLAEIRARIGVDDAGEDDSLELAITDACRAIDLWCGQQFYADTTATARRYRPADPATIKIDPFWTTTGLIIETDSGGDGLFATTWTASDYELDQFGGNMNDFLAAPYDTINAVRALLFPTWTRRTLTVQVTAKWGWTTPHQNVVAAARLLSVDMYKRKETAFGIASNTIDFGPVRIGRDVMAQVASLLQPLRRMDRMAGLA